MSNDRSNGSPWTRLDRPGVTLARARRTRHQLARECQGTSSDRAEQSVKQLRAVTNSYAPSLLAPPFIPASGRRDSNPTTPWPPDVGIGSRRCPCLSIVAGQTGRGSTTDSDGHPRTAPRAVSVAVKAMILKRTPDRPVDARTGGLRLSGHRVGKLQLGAGCWRPSKSPVSREGPSCADGARVDRGVHAHCPIGTLAQCDPLGIPSTSRWMGAAIIVRWSQTKTCIVTRSRTSSRPMPSSLAG